MISKRKENFSYGVESGINITAAFSCARGLALGLDQVE